jgi:nucleotide-binding universal stress UspA family protein
MNDNISSSAISAIQEFRTARFQANLERIRGALRGKSADLLSYEDVREKVRAKETNQRRLKDIPLDAIVGSVGRYTDFTRRFFPRQGENKERWTRIRRQVDSMEGLPPIEAYQLGDVFFVIDGNHRVSVARSLNAKYIEGFVTQVQVSVPLTAELDPDELIIAERYAFFLETTQLRESIPDIDLKMSAAGNYRFLEYQIRVHKQWLGEEISYSQAAGDWYRNVYCPIIQIIRERGMMRDFPERTETDLYVWIEKHRNDLAESLGWSLDSEVVATDLVDSFSQKPEKLLKRASHKLLDAITPDALEAGPMSGEWRKIWLATHQYESLFRHILVAINGREDGWNALKQALVYAKRENGRIYGLHVSGEVDDDNSKQNRIIQETFDQYCNQAGVLGELRLVAGNTSREICDSARWMDLVVISLAHPPGPQPIDRLSSGLSQLLRRSPRPVLAVPQVSKKIGRLLLAYDDSSTSREAMFIAAYLAKQWETALTVISVSKKDDEKTGIIDHAQQYLEKKNIQADYIERSGKAANEIINTAGECGCDLIIMGSYGSKPVIEIALGSTVDDILRKFDGSVLVCR